jgi:hypothetical protein
VRPFHWEVLGIQDSESPLLRTRMDLYRGGFDGTKLKPLASIGAPLPVFDGEDDMRSFDMSEFNSVGIWNIYARAR